MAKHLQLSLEANLDSDPDPEVKVTPLDQKVAGKLATTLEQSIAVGDLMDASPGDGKLQYPTRIKLPIKLFGRTFTVDYPVTIVLDVVDKA